MPLGDNRISAMNPWWTEAAWQSVAKSLPSSPVVVVGRDQLEHTPGLALVPAGLFLWALG